MMATLDELKALAREADAMGDTETASRVMDKIEAMQFNAPTANIEERIAANPLMRFASGAASPFMGAWQMSLQNPLSRALGHTAYLDRAIKTMEEIKLA